MGVELLAAATEQIDIKEANASFPPKMDEKKVTDPGLEHKDPSETVSVDGINGTKGEVKEADHAANSNLPKDAVDEWPASKQTHYFYFVRFRTYEDPQLKAKLEQADKELQRKNQSRFQITEALRAKRAERAIVAQLNPTYEKLKVVEDEINALEELRSVSERRDKAFETLNALRKTRDEAYAHFYQNRSFLNMAKDLATKMDRKGLEELCNTEVDKFMSRYSNDSAYRDDYEKRVLPFLDNRQLSRDGRMRNPDEKPIIAESSPATKLEAAPLEVIPKQTKEVVKSSEADKRGKAKAFEDNGNVHENDQACEGILKLDGLSDS